MGCRRAVYERTIKDIPFNFKVLVRDEGDLLVGYCLELGLVTAGKTYYRVWTDMEDVIRTHVLYAIENENMEHCYHSAPQEIWTAYFNAR
jgi:hypothetical protein